MTDSTLAIVHNHYFLRLAARVLDLLLIGLVCKVATETMHPLSFDPVLFYVLYNLVAACFGGRTLGKFTFSLKIESKRTGFSLMMEGILRELLFYPLLPFLFFNLLGINPWPLHDRIMNTKVVRDVS